MRDLYEAYRALFLTHEYRAFQGGYRCACGWTGSSQAEHMADVVRDAKLNEVAS